MNMVPIILGGYLYSVYTKTPYKNCVLPTLLATCLAPAVVQLAFVDHIPTLLGVVLGIGIGLFIGFIMPPLAAAMYKAHEGYNIYNVGFTAGLLGLALFALFRHLGVEYGLVYYWSSGYDLEFTIFLVVLSLYFIVCGVCSRAKTPGLSVKQLVSIDAADNDYFKRYAEKSYIAMGILGLASLAFMGAVNVASVYYSGFSGPVMGAIVSVVGFGAFGKALSSSWPVVAGAMLAAVTNMALTGMPFNHRRFLLAALFSTCLAPLVKRFGIGWGIVAGFVHLAISTNVGIFHGGMNLYNNGFAGGLTAMILLPMIKFFEEQRLKRKGA